MLKKLTILGIEFYGGRKFPGWVGDQLFCDMAKVSLVGCKNCVNLPPLGKLSSLKELFIQGMDGVKIVGPEFFGTGFPNIVGFQSLIKLRFMDMCSWEEWCADSTNRAFPCLKHLEMRGCMKLNKVSIATIPSLETLEIDGCCERVLKSMAGVGSVKGLAVSKISGLSKLDEGIIGCLGEVENLSVCECEQLRYLWEEEVACQVLEKLKSLTVLHCQQLESLGDEEQLLPHNLETLYLSHCDELEKMPKWKNSLTSLRRLTIFNCEKLKDNLGSTTTDLEAKTERQGESSSMGRRRHGEYEFSNLEFVHTGNCPSLKWFPTGRKLPTTLRGLSVVCCENMEDLVEEGMSSSLLESIYLSNWSKPKSLPQGLAHLSRLEIFNCQGIESILETSLPPTLISLMILNCSNLKNMLCVNEMQSLTSLRELTITKCENLEGYPSGGWRWPPKLESLTMGDVKQPIKEWGLATLPTSLHTLNLSGKFPILISFSEVGTQLPSSLTHLYIVGPKNLESLGEGLQNLSSLQRLCMYWCPKFRNLPETLLPIQHFLVFKFGDVHF